jgi:cytochrome c oxidase assembly factor CtaG
MKELMQIGWTWYPSVVVGLSIWTACYGLAIGPLRRHFSWGEAPRLTQQMAFHGGTLIGLLALVSPLDRLGDEYLFSAHMVQHLSLMFFTAPLWLAGLPGWLLEHMIPERLRLLAGKITALPIAFFSFVSVMWLWHVPAFFNLAQNHEGIHIFEHLTFIGGALIGWWPIAGPSSTILSKPSAPLRMIYIFFVTMACTGLAALITFSTSPLYAFYRQAPRLFGLSPLEDQHLGGLLMWLPSHMILLLALGITFLIWFRGDENHPVDRLTSNPRFRSESR